MWTKEDYDILNNLWESQVTAFCTNKNPNIAFSALSILGQNVYLGIRQFQIPEKNILMFIINSTLKHMETLHKSYLEESKSNYILKKWAESIMYIRISIISIIKSEPNIIFSEKHDLYVWISLMESWIDEVKNKMRSDSFINPFIDKMKVEINTH